jgi:hypothetical protein
MEDMTRYYEFQTTIRYYGPTAEDIRVETGHVYATVGKLIDGTPSWRAPHEYLAGLDLGGWQADRIAQFTRRFGPLAPRHATAPKDRIEPGDAIWIDTGNLAGLQELLRAAWRGDGNALEEIATGLTADLDLKAQPDRLELVVSDLWTLIRLLFWRDRANGKAKVCANPDCLTPWFLESRRGQKYCSHSCAVLINVRRFRERLQK